MKWQILQIKWKHISSWNSYPGLLSNLPDPLHVFITADSFSPFHGIQECNLHNTTSQLPILLSEVYSF